jgi:hypothetical protein
MFGASVTIAIIHGSVDVMLMCVRGSQKSGSDAKISAASVINWRGSG